MDFKTRFKSLPKIMQTIMKRYLVFPYQKTTLKQNYFLLMAYYCESKKVYLN